MSKKSYSFTCQNNLVSKTFHLTDSGIKIYVKLPAYSSGIEIEKDSGEYHKIMTLANYASAKELWEIRMQGFVDIATEARKIQKDDYSLPPATEHTDAQEEDHGAAKQTDNKEQYVGELKEGKYHGHGTLKCEDGRYYDGRFENGKKDGPGTEIYKFGEGEGYIEYEGSWKDGKRHGEGTLATRKRQDDSFMGIDEIYWLAEDEEQYEGGWKEDKFHGQGTYSDGEGTTYIGEYKDGEFHGLGTFIYSNDGEETEKYMGEYKDGIRDGQGISYDYDEKYVGEFEDDLFHGQGILTSPDGEKYVGEFENGGSHGQGILILENGDKYVGEFENGEMKTGTVFYADGKVEEKK